MDDETKTLIRAAMLLEQSAWLEEADKADSFTMIAIAKVIAEAFEKAAAKYKTWEAFNDSESSGTGSAWDDEHAATPTLSAASEARGEPRHSS